MVNINPYYNPEFHTDEPAENKAALQSEIDDDVAQFLAAGGTVQTVRHPTVEELKQTEWRNNSFVAEINKDRRKDAKE